MVELKHKNKTYYIEKQETINIYGKIAYTAYHLKRRCIWFGIITPFWKYVMESNYYGELRRDFYSEEHAIEYFNNHICKVVATRHRNTKIVKTLNCNIVDTQKIND